MVMKTILKKIDNFVCEKMFEMLPTQKLLHYLPQCDQKSLRGI